MPNRHYSDTALTEQLVFNVNSYEKTLSDKGFKFSTNGYISPNGADTATVNGQMQITTDAVNESVYFDYPTQIGAKYKFYVVGNPNQSDSFYLRLQRLSPQALISDHLMLNGLTEFEFTAQSTLTRLRPRRTDATNQGSMVSYIDRIILKRIRDTLYQDTITVATSNGYRYGFNGKERDDEWNGVAAMYDYGFRIYDPRNAKFLSVDPLFSTFPWWSPFHFAGNGPINNIDLDGLEALDFRDQNFDNNLIILRHENVLTIMHRFKNKWTVFTFDLNGPGEEGRGYNTIFDRIELEKRIGKASIQAGFYVSKALKDEEIYTKLLNSKIRLLRLMSGLRGEDARAGDIANVFKHFMFQTLLTSMVGKDAAKEIGDYHEREKFSTNNIRDTYTDLVNNEYARQYALEHDLDLEKILSSNANFAKLMNEILLHVINSVPEYKNDESLELIRNGRIKVFKKNDDIVKEMRVKIKFTYEQYKIQKTTEIKIGG